MLVCKLILGHDSQKQGQATIPRAHGFGREDVAAIIFSKDSPLLMS